jgi:type II secretory pathway component PulF
MRRNLIARWCDAMSVAVGSGLDLPAAIDLAGEAVGSPKLRGDGRKLIALVEAGRPLEEAGDLAILPPTAAAILAMASSGRDLPRALETLGQMYQQQAELRLSTIPAVLTPLLLLGIGIVIGIVIMAMFAPMFSLIQSVSGPVGKKW